MKNLDKKTLYRHICKLQQFAGTWNTRCLYGHKCFIFECTCIGNDVNGHQQNDITFMLSHEYLPDMDDMTQEMIKINYYDLSLLSSADIKRYIYQCNEYGIYCKPYEEIR